jgi:ribokinase
MKTAVMVAGSLHYDIVVKAPHMPQLDETLQGSAVDYVAGGRGGNQAVAASRHGARTFLAGKVGDDAPGRFLVAHLEAAGCDLAELQQGRDVKTGMSVAIVDANGDSAAVVVPGANLDIDAARIAIPPEVGMVVLQNELPESVNLALAERARSGGLKVVLNAAPARDMAAAMLAATDLLIVSRAEAGMMTGMPVANTQEMRDVARSLSHLVPEVVITLGAEGVMHCVKGGQPVVEPAFKAVPVSSHGAGDVFAGALVAQLAQGSEMDAAIHYAQAAAALHVSTPADKRHLIRPMQVRNKLGED